MIKLRTVASFCCTTALTMVAHAAEPQDTALLRLTAMVTTRDPAKGDNPNENYIAQGAGIITAQRGRTLYLVTARHVIEGCSPPECEIKVKFKRGRRVDASEWDAQVVRFPAADRKYERPGDLYDIVGLKVEILDGIPAIDFEVKRDPARLRAAADQIHAEGQIGGVAWSPSETSRISASDRLQFSTLRSYNGASGGAILNEAGALLGMSQSVDASLGAIAGIDTETITELATSVVEESFPIDWKFITPTLPVQGVPAARLTVHSADSRTGGISYQVPSELSKLPMGTLRVDLSQEGYVPTSIDLVRRPDVDQRLEYRLVRRRFPWALSSWVAGGALVLTGGVVGGVALHQHANFDSNPSRDTLDSVHHLNVAADAFFISGGAMLALGIVLHLALPTSNAVVVEK